VGSSVTGSVLHTALCALWEDAQDRGLFRYNVQQECRSRVVPGPLGFVAQLNEGRSTKKRPTEFAVDKVRLVYRCARRVTTTMWCWVSWG
jgi:GDP-L-galactose phosphorylase